MAFIKRVGTRIGYDYKVCYNRKDKIRTVVTKHSIYVVSKGDKSGTWYVTKVGKKTVLMNAGTMRDCIIGILVAEELV